MKKVLHALIAVVGVLLISGCASNADPTDIAKATNDVKEFMEEYPNAKVIASLYDESYVESIIDDLRDECGEQMLIVAYWKVLVEDPDSNSKIKLWIEEDSMKTVCVTRESQEAESGPGVSRSFSSSTIEPGGTVTVTLSVDVSGAEDFYAIDEIYPEGWEVTDPGTGSIAHVGHWKHVVIQGATNTEYTYTLIAPSEEGSYFFSGEYMFEGMSDTAIISGQDKIIVADD